MNHYNNYVSDIKEHEIHKPDLSSPAFSVKIAGLEIHFEINTLALQSHCSVLIRCGSTSLLCVVEFDRRRKEVGDFLALVVHFVSKGYAFGRIPVGPMKREGKSGDFDVLLSRLIDRSVRPLIDPRLRHPIQILCTLLSRSPSNSGFVKSGDVNEENIVDIEFLALLGVSVLLELSEIPLISKMPLGLRVGMKEDLSFFLNLNENSGHSQNLDLFVTFADQKAVMVECEAREVEARQMVAAVAFARSQCATILSDLEGEIASRKPKKFEIQETDTQPLSLFLVQYESRIKAFLDIKSKALRNEAFENLETEILGAALSVGTFNDKELVKMKVLELKKRFMRRKVLDTGYRIDGRKIEEIRPITAEVNPPYMVSSHGSACFSRGDTKAVVSLTLGTAYDEPMLDSFFSDKKERVLFHYNFPSYCTGDIGALKSPGRREIGHGRLCLRALREFLPDKDRFPYTIRLVSEVVSCDGSSSMASVCGATLALMDAGVPLEKHVAGIALGVVVGGDDDQPLILSDIIGDEDHLGDMDFKVAGTVDGISALQMDVKQFGIASDEMMLEILERAMVGLRYIVDKMQSSIQASRIGTKENAPIIFQMPIERSQVRLIIGNRGETIRTICEVSKAKVEVDSNNLVVNISSTKRDYVNKAKEIIEDLILRPEVGKVYEGIVEKVADFGVFVRFLKDKAKGLIHERSFRSGMNYSNVKNEVRAGDPISVKVTFIGSDGKVGLCPSTDEETSEDGATKDSSSKVEGSGLPSPNANSYFTTEADLDSKNYSNGSTDRRFGRDNRDQGRYGRSSQDDRQSFYQDSGDRSRPYQKKSIDGESEDQNSYRRNDPSDYVKDDTGPSKNEDSPVKRKAPEKLGATEDEGYTSDFF